VLPLTAVGKIHKPTLRENVARLVVEEALGEQFPALETAVSAKIVKTGEMHIEVLVDQPPSELQALLEKLQSELKLVICLKENMNSVEISGTQI